MRPLSPFTTGRNSYLWPILARLHDPQPTWIALLLRHVHFEGRSPFDIFHSLNQAPSTTLVSNGGADYLRGSAGWVIAIGNVCLIKGQCPVPGFNPWSYQAEGYGMLAGLLFLHHL